MCKKHEQRQEIDRKYLNINQYIVIIFFDNFLCYDGT